MLQKPKMPSVSRQIAHSDKSVRDGALEAIKQHLQSNGDAMSDLEMLKLWKGLFYCFWMSDKPQIQEHLALQLADLTMKHPLRYIQAFWDIVGLEWFKVDGLRLDKFYMLFRKIHGATLAWLSSTGWHQLPSFVRLVLQDRILSPNPNRIPDSIKFHVCQVLLDSLESIEIDEESMDVLLTPFIAILSSSGNKLLVNHVIEDVLLKHWATDGLRSVYPVQRLIERLSVCVATDSILPSTVKSIIRLCKSLSAVTPLLSVPSNLCVEGSRKQDSANRLSMKRKQQVLSPDSTKKTKKTQVTRVEAPVTRVKKSVHWNTKMRVKTFFKAKPILPQSASLSTTEAMQSVKIKSVLKK